MTIPNYRCRFILRIIRYLKIIQDVWWQHVPAKHRQMKKNACRESAQLLGCMATSVQECLSKTLRRVPDGKQPRCTPRLRLLHDTHPASQQTRSAASAVRPFQYGVPHPRTGAQFGHSTLYVNPNKCQNGSASPH